MKIMRKPKMNAAVILVVTIFYSMVFIITSGHLEFRRMLEHSRTLKSVFWNTWSDFLINGNLKCIGYAYILFAVVIVALSLIKKRDYDEYQTGILEKVIIEMGTVMVFLFPVALLLILSDPLYSIETVMLLVVTHWSTVLITDLIYVIKLGKS